jgi:hypothetical protein
MWNPSDDNEFFIGYAPPMPPRLARFVKTVVLSLGGSILVWAAVLAAGHVTLEGGTFEFGHAKALSGIVVERPYPALQPDVADAMNVPWTLLVAPGKHGADALVRGLDGQRVTLTGTRIHRGSLSMIEVEPGSLVVGPSADRRPERAAPSSHPAADEITVTGEIVDSKCFLGVMVPGSGKTHKECASLCLRGAIPPALHVQDRSGHLSVLLLAGRNGERLGAEAIRMAGEAISVTGAVDRQGGWLVLRTDPRTWQPINR